tara:strand:- start:13 stop:504 length:492 start_codon:yes stop_codon:yes gene_type:complete
MRCIVVLFVAATFFSSPVWPVEYRHLAIRFVEAKNFVRLSEYFTGRENPGNRLICRSQPEERSGLYFILTLSEKSRKLPEGSAFVMEVIRPDDPEAKTIRIPVPEKRPRGKEVYLGLTGADWPDKSARPVAWRLRLVDASGEVLADRKSFLWEHPAKKAESGS